MSQLKARLLFTLYVGAVGPYYTVRWVDKARIAELILAPASFGGSARFADRRGNVVHVRQLDFAENAPIGRDWRDFPASYEWIVDSIIVHGQITDPPKRATPEERRRRP